MARIVVIENNPQVRELLLQILVDEGHRVQAFSWPANHSVPISPDGCDLVITDWYGLEDLEHLRALAPGAPILLLTGQSPAVRLGAEALGVAAVVLRPFDLDALLLHMNHLLANGGR